MHQQFNVGFCTFSYGGNGGISSEVPDIREWMVPLVSKLARDPRIKDIRLWNLADTPITMTRNRAVIMAREAKVDVLVMIDSDVKPDMLVSSDSSAKPFFASSFDFLLAHYNKGPCVIGAPYCGPPPKEDVYVFRWQNMQSNNANPDYQLEMYDRHTAAKLTGIQECAALPTGLIMYDMRSFELTEPQTSADKPWFYYEWKDKYCADKASTEDVTQTRDLSFVGTQKLGYNPLFCNWDAWTGHWKPKCVGKPQVISASGISDKLKTYWQANHDGSRLATVAPSAALQKYIASTPDPMDLFVSLSDGPKEKLLVLRSLMDASPRGKFVEIGNREGGTLLLSLSHPNSTRVIGIDPYGGKPYALPGGKVTREYDDEMYLRMAKSVIASGNGDKLLHHKRTSQEWIAESEALNDFAFVFLDGRHDKETVEMELAYFAPRMAAGGIICVDDVCMIPEVDLDGYTRVLDMAYKKFSG